MMHSRLKQRAALLACGASCLAVVAAASMGSARGADRVGLPVQVVDGKIGYVLATRHWAVYQAPGAKEVGGSAECPKGFNDGPREQFETLFPNKAERTVLETSLAREGSQWFPTTEPEKLEFKEAGGKIAYGLNLDGKIGRNDFTSPDGVKGVDNQHYRAIGCISSYRGPNGTIYDIEDTDVRRHRYNRLLVEISGVDSLVNDDDVTVRTYRGLDRLIGYANGTVMSGGTQRVDSRYAKYAQAMWKGKIVDGVLMTEPGDFEMPAGADFSTSGTQQFKGLRFQLKLTPDTAVGLMAGYVDVENFYYHLNTTWATHFHSYGQVPPQSLYRALRRLADGYPDPATGQNTSISSALEVTFAQAYIAQPEEDAAANAGKTAAAPARADKNAFFWVPSKTTAP
jgi:hypothetical protein